MIPSLALCQRVDPLIFSERIYDFGEINEKGGKVEHEFTFVNNTARIIKILSVETSCGCTTTGYSKDEIRQAKTGFIKASFDPLGRPGYFNKSISVLTDYNPEAIILQIKGQVIAREAESSITELVAKNGNLRLKHNSFSFSRLFINQEPIEKAFTLFNNGDKPIHFTGKVSSPSYISASIPEVIAPKQKAVIKIKYNARQRNQYGFYTDNIEWMSDDELQPVKSFMVYATIEEYFAPVKETEKIKVPRLQLDQQTVSIGRIVGDGEIQREITLKNMGKQDLVIRELQPNCTCLTGVVNKKKLSSNEEVKLIITFSPKGRVGQQNKSITIYSTDPQNPVQRLIVTGYIPSEL